jgi:hypothetical protein
VSEGSTATTVASFGCCGIDIILAMRSSRDQYRYADRMENLTLRLGFQAVIAVAVENQLCDVVESPSCCLCMAG